VRLPAPISALGQEAIEMSTEVRSDVAPDPQPSLIEPVPGRAAESTGAEPAGTDDVRVEGSVELEQAGLYVPVDGAFHRIAKMTASVFDAPIATVSIIGDDRVWFPAAEGLGGMTEAPVDAALLTEIRGLEGPFVIDDAATDPRTMDHPVVRGGFGVRFYAAAPIAAADGQVLGTLEAMDRKRRRRVTPTQLGLLADLAATVAQLVQIRMSALNALRKERAGREAENDRRKVADRLAAQMSLAVSAEQGRERPEWCQLGGFEGCDRPTELKVADSWGDSAWGCWIHAEEALVQVPSVFLANESPVGLTAYRERRSRS
jgi:hypothetical protein